MTPMPKNNDDGFTFMELLVSISIMVILGSGIFIAFSGGMRVITRTAAAINTGAKIIGVDRFIREQADAYYIPYWLDAEFQASLFQEQLWRSRVGAYIKEIEIVRDDSGFVRGITATSEIGGKRIKTLALFPSVPVVSKR